MIISRKTLLLHGTERNVNGHEPRMTSDIFTYKTEDADFAFVHYLSWAECSALFACPERGHNPYRNISSLESKKEKSMSKKKNKKSGNTPRGERPIEAQYMVYTDGGCSPNPGGPGGFGIVFLDPQTGETWEHSEGYVATTNNRMELRAVLTALTLIRERKLTQPFILYTDSQYVINVASGTWRRLKNTDLWHQYDALSKGLQFRFHWVKGHDGDPCNERCDELATEAMAFPDKRIDEGYGSDVTASAPKAGEVSRKGGAMGVRIETEARFNDHPPFIPVKEYAERYDVHESCARAILDFYRENKHSFRSYVALKTGGIDAWSRKKADFIEERAGTEVLRYARDFFGDEKQALSCAKWRCRGLALEDAVRKVLVDAEVTENAIKR